MGFVQPPGFPGPDSGAPPSQAPVPALLHITQSSQTGLPPPAALSTSRPADQLTPAAINHCPALRCGLTGRGLGPWTLCPLPTPPRPGSILGDPRVQRPPRLSSPEGVSCEPRVPPAHARTRDIRHGPWAAAGAHTPVPGQPFLVEAVMMAFEGFQKQSHPLPLVCKEPRITQGSL